MNETQQGDIIEHTTFPTEHALVGDDAKKMTAISEMLLTQIAKIPTR